MGHSFLIGGAGHPQSGRGPSGAERRIGPRESGAGARIEPRKETEKGSPRRGEPRIYKMLELQHEAECQQKLTNIVSGKIGEAYPTGALAAGVEVERDHQQVRDEKEGNANAGRPTIERNMDTEKRRPCDAFDGNTQPDRKHKSDHHIIKNGGRTGTTAEMEGRVSCDIHHH